MPVVHCPVCTKQLIGPDDVIGRSVRCPKCANRFVVTDAMAIGAATPIMDATMVDPDDPPALPPVPVPPPLPPAASVAPARKPPPPEPWFYFALEALAAVFLILVLIGFVLTTALWLLPAKERGPLISNAAWSSSLAGAIGSCFLSWLVFLAVDAARNLRALRWDDRP